MCVYVFATPNSFSVDVEGDELVVLGTHDWQNVPVGVLLVETTWHRNSKVKAEIEAVLWQGGMCRLAVDVGHGNEVWLNRQQFV